MKGYYDFAHVFLKKFIWSCHFYMFLVSNTGNHFMVPPVPSFFIRILLTQNEKQRQRYKEITLLTRWGESIRHLALQRGSLRSAPCRSSSVAKPPSMTTYPPHSRMKPGINEDVSSAHPKSMFSNPKRVPRDLTGAEGGEFRGDWRRVHFLRFFKS